MEDQGEAALCYHLRDTKPAGGDIKKMAWSPILDLMVAAFSDDTLILNRLSWQRVWTVAPSGDSVTELAWRPDGRVIAVGRSDTVTLHGIEKGTELSKLHVGAPVTCLHWVEWRAADSSYELSHPLLPKGRSQWLGSKDEGEANPLLQPSKEVFSVLLVGDQSGRVHLWVDGVLCAGSVQVPRLSGCQTCPVLFAGLTEDHSSMTVVSSPQNASLQVNTVGVSMLPDRMAELHHLATVSSSLCYHIQLLNSSLSEMRLTWEGTVKSVENKFTAYSPDMPEAKSEPESHVTGHVTGHVTLDEELLLLLASGQASPALKDFLTKTLTAQGLRTWAGSLQHSHQEVHKMAAEQVSRVAMVMETLFSDLLGLSKWYDRFGVLGLREGGVAEALKSLGGLLGKNMELLKVIEQSSKSVEAFARWLHSVATRLSESSSEQDNAVSTKDWPLVMDYLLARLSRTPESQGEESCSGRLGLGMVGQYLSNQELTVTEATGSTFLSRIAANSGLEDRELLSSCRPEARSSLVQCAGQLQRAVEAVFAPLATVVGASYTAAEVLTLPLPPADSSHRLEEMVQGCCYGDAHVVVFPVLAASVGILVVRPHREPCMSVFELLQFQGHFDRFAAIEVYDSTSFSVAMESTENKTCVIAQFSFKEFLNLQQLSQTTGQDVNWSLLTVNGGSCVSQVFKVPAFTPRALAVSGQRKLACLVSKCSRVVKLFDVNAIEEDDDDDNDQDNH